MEMTEGIIWGISFLIVSVAVAAILFAGIFAYKTYCNMKTVTKKVDAVAEMLIAIKNR